MKVYLIVEMAEGYVESILAFREAREVLQAYYRLWRVIIPYLSDDKEVADKAIAKYVRYGPLSGVQYILRTVEME